MGFFGPLLKEVVSAPDYPAGITPGPTEMTRHGILGMATCFAQAWIKAVLHMVEVDGGDVSLSLADQITCPLLLLLGRADRLNPAEYAQRFVDTAGHGRLELFDCGHPIHTQQPEAIRGRRWGTSWWMGNSD